MIGGYDQVQSADFDIEAILNSYSNQMDSEAANKQKKKTFNKEFKEKVPTELAKVEVKDE
jgi:hypothetical protein